ncbi:GAF and ANTAR domain-containing protein [Amycolatopsis sp. NBC_00355]|uniref:GAF and ANTAR domain-containing protein n=1 Tax=Amycolatopsis sp. NBC_00355 TaxID=2975957 RepID=UPI002E255AED
MSGMTVPAPLPLDREVAGVAARLSGLLLSRETVNSVLELVVTLAGTSLPRAAGAGVTLLAEDGTPATTAASGAGVHEADEQQYALGEGPCLTALAEGAPVRIDDTATDRRWPRWCAAAAEAGLRSVLTVPLLTGDGCLGAIKVYAAAPSAFGPSDEHTLTTLATKAEALVAQARVYDRAGDSSEEFKRVLRERDTVTMARGFLMAREALSEQAAAERLLSLARTEGRAPADIAVDILSASSEPRGSR